MDAGLRCSTRCWRVETLQRTLNATDGMMLGAAEGAGSCRGYWTRHSMLQKILESGTLDAAEDGYR